MTNILKDKKLDLIEKYAISMTILLYLFRTPIPVFKFPFLVLYVFLAIFLIIKYKDKLSSTIRPFLRNYLLILILVFILLLSFLFSNKVYLIVFKDLINSIILLTFLPILTLTIITKKDLVFFLKILTNLFIVFAFIISLERLLDLFNILNDKSDYLGQAHYFLESELDNIDYNFAVLPVIFGLVSTIYILFKTDKLSNRIFYNILLTIFALSIFFAGSRRALIVLGIILLLLYGIQLLSLFKTTGVLRKIGVSTRYFLLILIIIIISSWFIISNTSYVFKNELLNFLGSKNLAATRGEIALTFYRYNAALNPGKSYNDIYNVIWTPSFDPLDPDSGWGSRIHKTVFPLTGTNVEIVPKDAKGYYLDKATNAQIINNQAFSASIISNFEVDEDQMLEASVFCYASEDCDLSSVLICSLGSMGNPGAPYDFNRKGKWQKLTFKVNCTKASGNVLLFFTKQGVSDFSSMKGYLIFAYPQVTVTSRDAEQSYIINRNGAKIGTANETSIKIMTFEKKKFEYFESRLFNLHEGFIPLTVSPDTDKDPIRRWASRFISEDTTYISYSNRLEFISTNNDFISGRINRWQFAWKIYSKEYNWSQKILGGGFNFLNWFGYHFFSDKKISDYPHNPFLSVLLYSGLIGLIFYIILIYNVFCFYKKYIKEYFIFFIFFLITFFFSFFSGASPLDPPMMGFFVILPFFINYIHGKDEQK